MEVNGTARLVALHKRASKSKREFVSRVNGRKIPFFENGEVAFERRPNKANEKRRQNAAERKNEQLEKKLQDRNEVVAELLQEHVQLKKELGEP